ncbi:hypothetical protein OIU77_004220 [Salix suchowensis]|uniref:Uncharacterized protein n=1 Tax=Salix suchowensis TaxID=1278906 RepID=A0ABQ9ATQ5_9ROSI|nr:hypothetical protein OIU77_004220 [Salix suchowensis]
MFLLLQGQFRARTEIAPDQREKFLQRLQQVQQQGHSNILGMPPLTGGNHKQFSAQQNPLLQQFNSQSSSVSQASLGHGVQASGFNAVTSAALQQPNSIHRQSSQQVVMSSGAKDPEIGHSTVEEQQLMQNLPEDSTTESAHTSGLGKSLVYEDELTSPYTMDTSVCRIFLNLSCCVVLMFEVFHMHQTHSAQLGLDFKFP